MIYDVVGRGCACENKRELGTHVQIMTLGYNAANYSYFPPPDVFQMFHVLTRKNGSQA